MDRLPQKVVDLQVNGGFGIDLNREPKRLLELAERLYNAGTTHFCPTLVSAPFEKMLDIAAYWKSLNIENCLGAHLEGPFLNIERKGAHDARFFCAPPLNPPKHLEGVSIVTMAPELPGAFDLAHLWSDNIIISAGHSLASAECMEKAIDAGFSMITHAFNASAPFLQRQPGYVVAGLLDPRMTIGVIADGIHLHKDTIRLLHAIAPERILLVSDATGDTLGPFDLRSHTLASDATTLAGSHATLLECWDHYGKTCNLSLISLAEQQERVYKQILWKTSSPQRF